MYTYFKFDGTQTVNGAAPETIIQAFGWTKDKPLWFIEVDGEIRYNLVGSEDDVKAFIGESECFTGEIHPGSGMWRQCQRPLSPRELL